jgi:hypothetical protein
MRLRIPEFSLVVAVRFGLVLATVFTVFLCGGESAFAGAPGPGLRLDLVATPTHFSAADNTEGSSPACEPYEGATAGGGHVVMPMN